MPCAELQSMNAERLALKKQYMPLCAKAQMSLRACAKKIGVSPQAVCKMKKAYILRGESSFVHGNKGKAPPNKRIDSKAVAAWYGENFPRAPFACAHRAYCEEAEKISYTAFSCALKKEGIVSPKARLPVREKKKHLPRKERAQEGELVQIDGSKHDWLMNGQKTVIHGAIDDATHKVLALYMSENECLLGYNEMLRQIVLKFGIPRELYSDRSSIFFVTKTALGKASEEEQLKGYEQAQTQWQKSCAELGISLIAAYSPEAKGRIERLWQTLQANLPFIFRFKKIDTIAKANAYLSTFVDSFNERFAVAPQSAESAFRKPTEEEKKRLDFVLAVKKEVRTDRRGQFVYRGEKFRLIAPRACCVKAVFVLSEKDGVYALDASGERRQVELAEPICDCAGDAMSNVEKDLIRRCFERDTHSRACKIG